MESGSSSADTGFILLVDDDAAIRQLVLKVLARGDYRMVAAGSVAEALERLEGNVFDLAIVDKNLPDGSGLEIVERLRQRGDPTEVIVVTGYSDTDSAIRAVGLRVFRYLKKPFDLFAFDVDVRRALESVRTRRALESRTAELEAANLELMEALGRAREADARRIQVERLATLGYVAAGVSHEMNNPLAVLSMSVPPVCTALEELAGAGEGPAAETRPALERVARLMEPTRDAVELLTSIARDLRTLGRTTPAEPRPVALAAVVASALRLTHHMLRYKARVEVDVPEDVVVLGRENRLIQVFINLLSNAARAIPDGNVEGNCVAIGAHAEDGFAAIEVSDTGRGIAPHNLERIFARFFTQSGADESGGSGIGLSIVKEVLDEHGGTIEVRSSIGLGTTFTLRLPLTT